MIFHLWFSGLPFTTSSQVLTIISGVNSLSQQEAAELVFSMYSVLDLHQVGGHAERIVLQIALTLLTPTENELDELNQCNANKHY